MHLFDVLEKITNESLADTKWIFQLHRKSLERRGDPSKHLAGSSTSTDVLGDVNVIPNLFHTLDCSMTFDEVVDWLGKSEQVTNLMMLFEGLWTWMWKNKVFTVESSPQLLQKIYKIKENRKWNRIMDHWLNFNRHAFQNKRFFSIVKSDQRFCSSSFEKQYWISHSSNSSYGSIFSLFEENTRIECLCKHPYVKNCSKPGQCGFILKTVSAKDGANIKLCTDPSEYSEKIHYHEEFQAKDMHLSIFTNVTRFTNVSLSWCGKPEFKSGKVCWYLPTDMNCTNGKWTIHVLISLRDHNVSGT